MDYNDVKGPLLRYWKVRRANDAVGLADGDVLMFDGDSLGTITKLTPRTNPGDKRNTAVRNWATGFRPVYPPTPNFQYTITGSYEIRSGVSQEIRIDFKEESKTQGAFHQGTVDPFSTSSSTWMADEGP